MRNKLFCYHHVFLSLMDYKYNGIKKILDFLSSQRKLPTIAFKKSVIIGDVFTVIYY